MQNLLGLFFLKATAAAGLFWVPIQLLQLPIVKVQVSVLRNRKRCPSNAKVALTSREGRRLKKIGTRLQSNLHVR